MADVIIEPDLPPRDTPWHRRIVAIKPIEGTRSGNWLRLECDHIVQSFGNIKYLDGRAFCMKCRDASVQT